MGKKETITYHPKQKLQWVIFKGFRRLMPCVWIYVIPDLKLFKKAK